MILKFDPKEVLASLPQKKIDTLNSAISRDFDIVMYPDRDVENHTAFTIALEEKIKGEDALFIGFRLDKNQARYLAEVLTAFSNDDQCIDKIY